MSEDLRELLSAALPELRVRTADPSGTIWLASDNDTPSFCLLTVGGRPCLWHSDRTAAIAADLDSAEALLDRIEQVSGWRFEPGNVAATAPERVLVIGDTDTVLEMAFEAGRAAPPALIAAAHAAPRDPSRALPRTLTLLVPDVAVEQLSGLEEGDLLILPPTVNVKVHGAEDLAASLELATGRLAGTRWEGSGGRFAVPVGVRVPPVRLSDHDTESVRGGGSVLVGPLVVGTNVRLSVGGRDIASGTVVSLGQAIAVRIQTQEGTEA